MTRYSLDFVIFVVILLWALEFISFDAMVLVWLFCVDAKVK